jgi:hypothetical protein
MVAGMEFGFIRSILGLARDYPEARIRIVWDNSCLWRRDIFPDYKGVKESDPFRDDLLKRIDELRTLMAYILPQYDSSGCEADDVISALCQLTVPDNTMIYSPDKDFQQLVDFRITILNPCGPKGNELLNVDSVAQKWTTSHPRDLRWIRAYTGCSSDAVPGCGVPSKLLASLCSGMWVEDPDPVSQMLAERDSIEASAKSKLTPGWKSRLLGFHDTVVRNYRIMTLTPPRCGSFIRCDYQPDFAKFYTWTQQKGMFSLTKRIVDTFQAPYSVTSLEVPHIEVPWDSHDALVAKENTALGLDVI